MRLTQGDLLRNYLFMRLPTRGETVYQALWLPLQNTLSSQELEQLFWLDLVQRDPAVKQTDIYTAQQARLDKLTSEADIEAEIARFARLGELLKTLLNPVLEPDPDGKAASGAPQRVGNHDGVSPAPAPARSA